MRLIKLSKRNCDIFLQFINDIANFVYDMTVNDIPKYSFNLLIWLINEENYQYLTHIVESWVSPLVCRDFTYEILHLLKSCYGISFYSYQLTIVQKQAAQTWTS